MWQIFMIFMALLTLAGAVVGKPTKRWVRPLLTVVGLFSLVSAFGLL